MKSAIKTNRFILKKFKEAFITQNYLNWFKDDYVKKFILFKSNKIKTLEEDVKKKMMKKGNFFYAIFFEKKHIGNILIHKVDLKNKTAWMGILIGDKKWRGKGVAPEVINEISKNLFNKYKIKNLYLGLSRKNLPALNSYKKIGFNIINQTNQKIFMRLNIRNKFILGLVQFVQLYGIANENKKIINKLKVKEILKYFSKNQINELDTAESYNFDLKHLPRGILWNINTKIEINKKNSNINNLKKYIKNKILLNKNIFLKSILIHNPEMIFTDLGKKVLSNLYILKKKRYFDKIGISIYEFNDLKKIIKLNEIDIVQLPYNIIDRRYEKYQKYLKDNNIEVHARSIFLQGLLLSNKIKFKKFKKIKEKLNSFLYKRKISKIEGCINFVTNNECISKFIFGVQNLNQAKDILNYKQISKIIFPKNLISINRKIIDPRNWE